MHMDINIHVSQSTKFRLSYSTYRSSPGFCAWPSLSFSLAVNLCLTMASKHYGLVLIFDHLSSNNPNLCWVQTKLSCFSTAKRSPIETVDVVTAKVGRYSLMRISANFTKSVPGECNWIIEAYSLHSSIRNLNIQLNSQQPSGFMGKARELEKKKNSFIPEPRSGARLWWQLLKL